MNIHDNRRRFQNSQIGLAQPPMTAIRSATDFEIMQQEHILKTEQTLNRALKHEQDLNEQLRERVMELETENKTLKLQLQAKYAGRWMIIETARHTETPPAPALFGERDAARLQKYSGAGAAEAAEN